MNILIDCDPGHDDMMALMVAWSAKEIDLLGVTTVAGNQTGAKTYLNALKTLTLIGARQVPVSRGCDQPLFRKLRVAPEIHGVSGLDGADLPEPGFEGTGLHAVDFMLETLRRSPQPLTLVPTGPLTNIALMLLKDPGIKNKIERIVLMGGAVYDSNISPAAEFNIYVDPEAARIVFNSGLRLTMVGLDVTNKALLSFEEIGEIASFNGPISRVVAPLLQFFARANRDVFGFQGAPVHDALAVASLIEPTVIGTRRLHVDVETEGSLTRGRTVVDVYGVSDQPANADVALEVDRELFRDLMYETVRTLDRQCS